MTSQNMNTLLHRLELGHLVAVPGSPIGDTLLPALHKILDRIEALERAEDGE